MTNIGPATKGTFVYLTSPDGRRTVRSWVKVSIGDVWLPLSGGETCTWSDIVKHVDSFSGKGLRLDIEEAASADPATNGGGGTTGGTGQGETGAARKEADAGKAAVDGGDAPATVGAAEGPGAPAGLLADVPVDADDLKVLNGVGPKIEAALNEIGVYRLGQVAGWTEGELAWVDKRLGLGGRAVRGGWVEQARARLTDQDKGGDAARAALALIALKNQVGQKQK